MAGGKLFFYGKNTRSSLRGEPLQQDKELLFALHPDTVFEILFLVLGQKRSIKVDDTPVLLRVVRGKDGQGTVS